LVGKGGAVNDCLLGLIIKNDEDVGKEGANI
jgi:hypothetical protein